MGEELKLSYISNMFRVRLTIPHKVCRESPEVPSDILERARAKLQQVQREGAIEIFTLYESTLRKTWENYRAHPSPPSPDITLTVGEGCPKLKGFEIKAANDSRSIALLSIQNDASYLRLLRLEWIVLYVNHFLSEIHIHEEANPAHVHRAWLKAINGVIVRDLAIGPKPQLLPDENVKPFSIYTHASGEITLIVRNVNLTLAGREPTFLTQALLDASQKINLRADEHFQLLERETLTAIQSAMEGPESIGVRLPLVLLGGLALKRNLEFATPQYPGVGRLNLHISTDKLIATVEGFDSQIYADSNFVPNEEWLKRELRRYALAPEACKPFFENLLTALLAQESLEGCTVAEGVEAMGGSGPYLEILFGHKEEDSSEAEIVDMRSMQQIEFVKKGQPIAKISYDNPPLPGYDVFGHAIYRESESLAIQLGDGVIEKEPGSFYADSDGIPIVDEHKISLNKVMVHHGDVNLSSGNIVFDGPVEIFGSIDSGSMVETSGDLKVHGTIRGAIVRAKGDIEVEGGIVTGKSGRVTTQKNLKAEFIENSFIECGGSVLAHKVIINSDVIAGGDVEVTDNYSGLLAGGSISCRKNIRSANIGFKNGAVTKLNVGVDWKLELATLVFKKRLDRIKDVMSSDRQIVRELTSRTPSQLTEKQLRRREHFQRRLVKERRIMEYLQDKVRTLESQRTYNYESKILISNKVCTNVEINIGGGPVILKQDLLAVAILAKRRSGTKIVSYKVGIQLSERDED